MVEDGNWWKFTAGKQSVRLRELLLNTGDRELVEVSKFRLS